MAIAIDLILAVIMAATVITAVRRGFIVSVFKLVSAIAAVIVAVMFYKQLGAFFCNGFVYDKVYGALSDWVSNAAQNADGTFDLSGALAGLPEGLQTLLSSVGVDLSALNSGYAGLSAASVSAANELCETLSASLAQSLSNLLAFAALFFGALIVLSLVCFVLDKLCNLPLLKGTNRLLGLLFGICEALILGVVITALVSALLTAYGGLNPSFADADAVEHTYIAKFLSGFIPR